MSEAISKDSGSVAASQSKLVRRKWRTIVADAQLPKAVSDRISQTIQKTRLWRSEKSAIAIELVSHFQDGLVSGKMSEELLASFGDTKQAAKLMRSSKKRCRPLWWQTWWWMSRGIAAFFGLYIIIAIYQSFSHPTIKTNYLALINKPAEAWPDDQKAWPLYRKGLVELEVLSGPKWDEEIPFHIAITESTKHKSWPEFEKWFDSKQHAIALFREGSKRPGLGFVIRKELSVEDREALWEYWTNEEKAAKKFDRTITNHENLDQSGCLMFMFYPQFFPLRHIGYTLQADAVRAAYRNDGNIALADIEAVLRVARHCEELQSIIGELIGYSLRSTAMSTVHDILDEYPELWSDDQLKQLAHTIAGTELDMKRGAEGERKAFYDILQRVYSDDGNGDGRITQDGIEFLRTTLLPNEYWANSPRRERWQNQLVSYSVVQKLLLPGMNSFFASRKESQQRYDQVTDYYLALMDQPLWQYDSNKPDYVKFVDRDEFTQYRAIQALWPNYELLKNRMNRSAGQKEGVLIGIALELYRREHKTWPKSLEELSPHFLPSMPVDRINGTPLVYKIVDDRPLVYSKGTDGDDDNGTLPLKHPPQSKKTSKKSHNVLISAGFAGLATPSAPSDERIEWDAYFVGPPDARNPDDPAMQDGDWIIWTLLPEHRLVKP